MCFWILSPYKIESYEDSISDFIADDLLHAIQCSSSIIATSQDSLDKLQQQFPKYHKYIITLGK
ncbi:MAG: hypothetical protein WC942_01425 [Clostridia bacterium]|jgi:hypothetical protein